MEPTIVYKLNGPHRGPKGSTYQYKGVSDETTLKDLLNGGWFSSLEEAVNPPEKNGIKLGAKAKKPLKPKIVIDAVQ